MQLLDSSAHCRRGLTLAALCSCLTLGTAADWPQWRGPDFNGSSPETGLPASWTKADAVWSLDLPGPSGSTPVILGDKVFLSSTDRQAGTAQALAVDRATGRVLWNHKASDRARMDDRSTVTSPSPVADATRVIFFYGDGTLLALDHSGRELWSRNLAKDYGDFAFQFTFAASPTLSDGRLYLPVLQRNVPVNGRGRADGPIESFLLAMDPATGRTLWRHVRPSDARMESLESYGTAIPFEHGGRREILIAGGDCITGHDPATGRELWRWATWNPTKITHWRLVPSPVTGGGVILACAPKGSPVYAFKAGGSGLLADDAPAWKSPERSPVTSDVSTPAFYDGDFFVMKEERVASLSRVEPATGRVKWTAELPGRRKYEASPTAADGRVYVMNFAGEVAVIDAARGQVLGTVAMGEEGDDATRSTIPVAHGRLFIRTNGKLYAVGRR